MLILVCNTSSSNKVPLGCSDCPSFPTELSLASTFNNGQVLVYYFTINQVHVGVSSSKNVCLFVMLHWISSHAYIVTRKSAQAKLDGIIRSCKDLKKVPKAKRIETFYSGLKNFPLFNISCHDAGPLEGVFN